MLTGIIKKKNRESTQIHKKDMIEKFCCNHRNTNDHKRILRTVNTNKLDKLEEIGNFLQTYNIPRLN